MLLLQVPEVNPTENIIQPLAEWHPLVGVIATILIGVILWLGYENIRLKKRQDVFYTELKELASANVQVMSTLTHVADKMVDKMQNSQESMKTTLDNHTRNVENLLRFSQKDA